MQTTLVDSANLFRLVRFFDTLAAVVFAVSGALVASRKGMDVMGFMWFAVITGVGGGTVRDLILNVPVFWVQNPAYVSACLVTAVVTHFMAPRIESRFNTLRWFDAFGLALVTVAGTVKASDVGAPALVAINDARALEERSQGRGDRGGMMIPTSECLFRALTPSAYPPPRYPSGLPRRVRRASPSATRQEELPPCTQS
jgi:hypothetical protein